MPSFCQLSVFSLTTNKSYSIFGNVFQSGIDAKKDGRKNNIKNLNINKYNSVSKGESMETRTRRIHICDSSKFVSLGRTGENEFRTVEIDVSGWLSEDAEYRIIYSRPDGITYPVAATRNGDILLWALKAYDVEIAGFGSFEVRAYIGDALGKSAIFKIEVAESIQTNETRPDIVRPDWVDDIIDKVVIDSIEQTVTSTEDSGVNILTVTLTNGDGNYFEVRNGSKGDTGEKGEKGDTGPQGEKGLKGEKGDAGPVGAAGYTPQRGIDYWTEEDKENIVVAVLDALPNGDEVSY